MHSLNELKFAQKYPFSAKAKRIVEIDGTSIDSLPNQVIDSAGMLVKASVLNQKYLTPEEIHLSKDLLKNEVMAFPVAKMIVSKMNSFTALNDFSEFIALNAFNSLQKEKRKTIIDLAMELKLKFYPIFSDEFFASMKVLDYLGNDFSQKEMKLVNKRVEDGKVFLTKNDFLRVLTESIKSNLRNSLPLKMDSVPKKILSKAKELNTNLEKEYSQRIIHTSFGPIKPEFFPPCMKELHTSLLNGKNIPHMGRFAVAVFLLRIGMQKEQAINLFSKTPNFNEKITKYQVKRLAENDIAPPGCEKMREYDLCLENCSVKNPIQYYRSRVGK
jgi:DNA primase large subunit